MTFRTFSLTCNCNIKWYNIHIKERNSSVTQLLPKQASPLEDVPFIIVLVTTPIFLFPSLTATWQSPYCTKVNEELTDNSRGNRPTIMINANKRSINAIHTICKSIPGQEQTEVRNTWILSISRQINLVISHKPNVQQSSKVLPMSEPICTVEPWAVVLSNAQQMAKDQGW